MLTSLSSAIKQQKSTSLQVSNERFDQFFAHKKQQIKFFDTRVGLINSLNNERVEFQRTPIVSGIKPVNPERAAKLRPSASEYRLSTPVAPPAVNRGSQAKPERTAWKPRPDVVVRAQSVKCIRTIKQKQNLNIFTELEANDADILKLRITKGEIRDMAAVEERLVIQAERDCKAVHWRVHLKQQQRDKLCRELQELNNKFAKVSKEVGLLSTHLENVKQQYKTPQECIAGITLPQA